MPPISEDEIERIRLLYEESPLSIADISKEVGLSASHILLIRRMRKWASRKLAKRELYAKIRVDYESGMHREDIVQKYSRHGVTQNSLAHAARAGRWERPGGRGVRKAPLPKRDTPPTELEWSEIQSLYEKSSQKVTEIASQYGISRQRIYQRITSEKWKRR